MKTAIIFDLWETLGTKNIAVSKSLQQHFDIPKSDDFPERYEKAVQLQKWETEEQMADSFLLEFGIEQTDENKQFVIALFKKGVEGATLFPGIKDLLLSLKEKGLKLGLLSNTTVFESVVLHNLEIDALFDVTVFSWDKGNLKPSFQAFEHVLNELGVEKESAVFIDDTKKNTAAAEEYGITAIRFESVPQVQEVLKEFEIL